MKTKKVVDIETKLKYIGVVRKLRIRNKGGDYMLTVEETKQPYYKLFDIMRKKNIKQKEVAEAIGMNRSEFNSKINRSNGRDFWLEEAGTIADYLEINIDDFF